MGGAAICIEFTYGHDDRYMGMMRNDFHALYTMQLGGVIGGGFPARSLAYAPANSGNSRAAPSADSQALEKHFAVAVIRRGMD